MSIQYQTSLILSTLQALISKFYYWFADRQSPFSLFLRYKAKKSMIKREITPQLNKLFVFFYQNWRLTSQRLLSNSQMYSPKGLNVSLPKSPYFKIDSLIWSKILITCLISRKNVGKQVKYFFTSCSKPGYFDAKLAYRSFKSYYDNIVNYFFSFYIF